MSKLLASLGHSWRRVVLGHTLNTLRHVITKQSHNVLSKFVILWWATFIAILSHMWPMGHGLDTRSFHAGVATALNKGTSLSQMFILVFFNKIFKRFYLFTFRGGGREEEREGNINGQEVHWLVASRSPPTGDLAHNPGLCPDWELNWQPLGSQVSAQSTEPHQPRLILVF